MTLTYFAGITLLLETNNNVILDTKGGCFLKSTSQEKKKFEEERARRILLHFFPDEYTDTVLSESPDIISTDCRLGVEVTDSHSSAFREQLSRAGDSTGKTCGELTAINLRDIETERIVAQETSNGRYLAGFAMWGNQHLIQTSYKKKLKKLNSSHFTKCTSNQLFIFAWLSDEEDIFGEIKEVLSFSGSIDISSYVDRFDKVFIFAEPKLHMINVTLSEISTYTLSSGELTAISEDAFYSIFGTTRTQYNKRTPIF